MERLMEKVAIVTGGGGGIGGATARALAREGASVLVVDIDLPAAEEVAQASRAPVATRWRTRRTCPTKPRSWP